MVYGNEENERPNVNMFNDVGVVGNNRVSLELVKARIMMWRRVVWERGRSLDESSREEWGRLDI